jgi:thioredoxin reductase
MADRTRWVAGLGRPATQPPSGEPFDVVIVGGGAAGLSAALVLGRARRRVAVIDGGAPRNAPAAHMQGFLSRDGMPPVELLTVGREEVRRYGVEIIRDQAVQVEDGFRVHLESGDVLEARRLLIATGVRDELPEIPGAAERWGRDFLHCPYCHGWEVRDQPIAVLATQNGSVLHAHLLWQWSDDVVFFTHSQTVSATDRAQLEARDIKVIDGLVVRFVIEDDHLVATQLDDGTVVPRTAIFIRPANLPRNDGLLEQLRCEIDEWGFPAVDATGQTSTRGVWAAGNIVDPRMQVIAAAGAANTAAIAINTDLVIDDIARSDSTDETKQKGHQDEQDQ